MAQKRLTMRMVRKILAFHIDKDRSARAIATHCGLAQRSVGQTLAGTQQQRTRTAAGRLQGEIAYGTALFGGGFTATPNMGFGISDGGGREYRLGWRLTPALQGSPRFEVSLDATRNEAANGNAPAHGVMLRSTVSW